MKEKNERMYGEKKMVYARYTLRSCSIGINRLRLVWLINLFNRYQPRLKRLKKHGQRPLSFTRALYSRSRAPASVAFPMPRSLVMTIPRSYRVSTEKRWKIVLFVNLNRFNLSGLRKKRSISVEDDLNYISLP